MGPRLSKNESIIDVATEIVNNVTNEIITTNSTTVSNTQSITIDLEKTIEKCTELIDKTDCSKDPKSMACNGKFMNAFCNTDIGVIKQEITQTVNFDESTTNELSNAVFMELDKNLKSETEMKTTNAGLLSIDMQKNLTQIRENFTQDLVNRAVTDTVKSYSNNQIIDLKGAVPSGGVYQNITSDIISTSIVSNIMNNSSEIKSAIEAINKAKYESRGPFDFSLGGVIGLFVILFILVTVFLIRRSAGGSTSRIDISSDMPPPVMYDSPPVMYGPQPEPRWSRFKRKYIPRFNRDPDQDSF